MSNSISSIRAELEKAKSVVNDLDEKLRRELHNLVYEQLGSSTPRFMHFGNDWDCKNSPTGKCVYDSEDECYDDCLSCHQTEQRAVRIHLRDSSYYLISP